MTAPTPVVAGPVRSAEDLRRLMGTDYTLSPQQWSAVSAPLEPAVVIAGAGSGKTSLMAARVVYLVATGAVTPDQVLGLTFTTKAASQLATRVREALEAAGLGRSAPGAPGEEEVLEPTIATYHSYAAGLLSEHGLRLGHEPDTRVMADASRYQLAGRAIARHTRPVRSLTDSPKHAVDYVLALEAAMSEHLVEVGQVRAFHAAERPRFEAALATARARKDIETVLERMDQREEILDLVEGYRRLKAQLGLMDFSDQIALAARLADEHPEVGAAGAGEVPDRPPRRVPRHLGGPGADARTALLRAVGDVRARPPGHRRRRPQPGDLRLARGVGLQHPGVRARPSRPPTATRAFRRTPSR